MEIFWWISQRSHVYKGQLWMKPIFFQRTKAFLRRAAKVLSFCINNVKLNLNYVIKHNGEACFMIQIYETKSFIVAWLIYDELRIAKCV